MRLRLQLRMMLLSTVVRGVVCVPLVRVVAAALCVSVGRWLMGSSYAPSDVGEALCLTERVLWWRTLGRRRLLRRRR